MLSTGQLSFLSPRCSVIFPPLQGKWIYKKIPAKSKIFLSCLFPFLFACKQLQLNPLDAPPSLLQPLLITILKQEQPANLETFASFLTWLEKNSKFNLKKLPGLCTILKQIPEISLSRNTFKVQPGSTFTPSYSLAPSSFTSSSYFICQPCTTNLPTTFSALLHLAEMSPTTCNIACSSCTMTISLSKLKAGSLKEVKETQAVLDIHLVTRQHIAGMFGEVQHGEAGVCDPCGVALPTDKEQTKHVVGKEHQCAIILVEEYVRFCSARSLIPTSHRNFPSFVFFLRFFKKNIFKFLKTLVTFQREAIDQK